MIKKLNEIKIAVIGLGYVGLPLALEFSKKYPVVGLDLDKNRVDELNKGYDHTNEISKDELKSAGKLKIVTKKESIKKSNIYIITVPTPVDKNNAPDLTALKSATTIVGNLLDKNDIVIYESTVFPGCTEEVCVPILEHHSNLQYNQEFFCGYSPERINPGDKKHSLKNVVKITSGSNEQTAGIINQLYNSIITAGTFKTSSIAVAESAKVIENTQRDVNIALINELALIFNKLDLDTTEVLEAAETKWNFFSFRPGLVGGHCIGVDPYYLTQKATEVGYHPEMILAGRRINDNMGYFLADNTIGELTKQGVNAINANVTILGLTFKENCPDLRNTKVLTIVEQLKHYKCNVQISDDCADPIDAKNQFGLDLVALESIKNQDALIIAVAHNRYTKFTEKDWRQMLNQKSVVIDVKSLYNKEDFKNLDCKFWRL